MHLFLKKLNQIVVSMKKISFVLIFVLGSIMAGNSQNNQVITVKAGEQMSVNSGTPVDHKEIGTAVMEFMYDYSYLRDTTDVTSAVTDRMVLQVGYGLSKFTSYRVMQIDSLIRVSTADQIKANPGRYVGGETFSIYKNYPAGKFTTTDKIATDWFLIEELIPTQEWIMTADTNEILGYKCRSAKCSFRGRDYIAYYTDEIPVADGPWKFGGLPGFIMEVRDINNHYSFVCVGINSKANRQITMPQVEYNKTSRVKFYQTKHRYDINPTGYLETVSGVKVSVTTPDGKPRTDLTQPRQLTYDYIETDWKNY